MNEDNVLVERLNSLIEKDLLSVDVLHEATGIERILLANFLLNDKSVVLSKDNMEESKNILRLFTITDCLIEGMGVSEDARVKGIIDVLVEDFQMDYKMIAGYMGMEKETIVNFMSDSNQLPYEKKYTLAVKVFSLVQALKNI